MSKHNHQWRKVQALSQGRVSSQPPATPDDVLATVATLRDAAAKLEMLAPSLAGASTQERLGAWVAICLAGKAAADALAALPRHIYPNPDRPDSPDTPNSTPPSA